MADQRELSPQAREDLIEIWEDIAQFSEEAVEVLSAS